MFILEELFCPIDDFCLNFEPMLVEHPTIKDCGTNRVRWRKQLIQNGLSHRQRDRQLSLSEIMTILISFQTSNCRNFKAFYLGIVSQYWQNAFPNLVSYSRFIEWIPSTLVPLMTYLRSRLGTSTGIGFVDSTSLKVCHNRRISNHRVFRGIARRGKTSVDWFAACEAGTVVVRRRSGRTPCALSFI